MSQEIKKVVILGGGTAGWLTASIVAAHHNRNQSKNLQVVLVESSDIPTVGVGEGTWPTMKSTISQIGIKESELFKACHAVFKQGGKFVNWVHGNGDFYYHPFTVPMGYGKLDLAPYVNKIENYAVEANFQHHVCEAGLAPRTIAEPEFQGSCNYAYHLDAGELADFLKRHCVEHLGVEHVVDTMVEAVLDDTGAIDSLILNKSGAMTGDVFVDCSGASSLLLGKTLGVDLIKKEDVLFNDSALAMQVPYESESSPIACHTIATAQDAGWIWDIGLTHRRGVGHVYSSKFTSDEDAEANLRRYLGDSAKGIPVRKITYTPGHREKFWFKNCVAVGMAAGFVEPLEATAIMLIEISAKYIAEHLPVEKSLLPITAKRFNQQMDYRWSRIIDFLKLHYMLTKRPEPYWQAHCDEDTIPESLKEDLALWQYRGPIATDFAGMHELFPAASYQYVLYGMEFKPDYQKQAHLYQQYDQAEKIIQRNHLLTEQLLQTLPSHREYIEQWLARAC